MCPLRPAHVFLSVLLCCGACATPRPGPPEGLDTRAQLGWWLDRWEAARPAEGRGGPTEGLDPDVIRRGLRELALARDPDATVSAANGLLALEQGDLPRAERWLDDALSLDPHLPSAVQARAQVALQNGNTAAARRLLLSLQALRPELGSVHEALAGVAFLDGDLEAAADSLQRAEALAGASARLAYHRGLVAEFAHDEQAALAHYAEALKLEPGHVQATRRRLALVLSR